jgi:hypothetical protein
VLDKPSIAYVIVARMEDVTFMGYYGRTIRTIDGSLTHGRQLQRQLA